jgi:hypothetical protein
MDPFASQMVGAGSPGTISAEISRAGAAGIANYFILMTPFWRHDR